MEDVDKAEFLKGTTICHAKIALFAVSVTQWTDDIVTSWKFWVEEARIKPSLQLTSHMQGMAIW